MTTEEMLQVIERFVESDLPQPEKLYLLDNFFRSLCQQQRMVAQKRGTGKDTRLSQATTEPHLDSVYK